MNSTKSLLLVLALMLAAGPAMAHGAQKTVDHDRDKLAKAQGEQADPDNNAKQQAHADANVAQAAAKLAHDLAACPHCH